MVPAVLEALRHHFGHQEFREGQEAVVKALVEGRSALAVFPTGGGKSLCYQLPALLLDGLTLVVSPLIALMKDQVDSLKSRGIPAARLDSTLQVEEVREIYEQLDTGQLKILYAAPERFSNEAFRQRVKKCSLSLVAIDEAHCISEWGHNFRPDYLKLAKICRTLKVPRVLCLTATATPKVAKDIRKQFRIAASDHVQLSFHRPNLDLRITPCNASDRKALLLERLTATQGAAVVYVTRQETAEEVATYLAKQGLSARAYHAGLPDEFRSDAQVAFMEGRVRIIVATIAFGMGIDKSDIRAVYHYNLPKSLENHTQEIGRAGRDGNMSICEMLFCPDDLTVLENFVHSDAPSAQSLSNLIDRILRLGNDFDVSPYDLSLAADMRPGVVSTVLTYLEIDGWIQPTGTFYSTYRLKLLSPVGKLAIGRPPQEKKLIEKILDSAELKWGWMHVLPDELASHLAIKREKIVTLLQGMNIAGDISLSVYGVRQVYKIKKQPGSIREIADDLAARFSARENADLSRIEQVVSMSSYRGCLTGYLTRHYGEKLTEPCGHCDRCRGVKASKVKKSKVRRVTDEELQIIRDLVAAKHAALSTPRQLARFLCGMRSPASTKAKLPTDNAFGLLADLPFADVLAVAAAIQ